MNKVDELYNELAFRELFTEEELILITTLNGYSVETLNNCLYVRYGYRSLGQMDEE